MTKPIVKILGRRYRLGTRPGKDNIANINFLELKIDILPWIHMEEAVDSLFHEMFHAALMHQDCAPDEEQVEHVVKLLETAAISFLRDNSVSLAPLEKLIRQSRK